MLWPRPRMRFSVEGLATHCSWTSNARTLLPNPSLRMRHNVDLQPSDS